MAMSMPISTRLGTFEALDAAINWYRAPRVASGALALPDVPAVTVPTMYLWGDQDATVGRAAAEATADFVTGPYRFEVLKGVGHFITDQAPERTNELLLDWLTTRQRRRNRNVRRLERPFQHGHNGHMEKVTISQLKNSLSAYLKKVRAGQTVLILDRNEPIAILERVNKLSLTDDERLARLEQAGLIKRSKTSNPLAAMRGYKPIKSKASVVEALIEERRESP